MIVEEKFWSQVRSDMQQGNDWYGTPSRHRVIEAGEPNAVDIAASILTEARQHLSQG